jgi:hypothetical protein
MDIRVDILKKNRHMWAFLYRVIILQLESKIEAARGLIAYIECDCVRGSRPHSRPYYIVSYCLSSGTLYVGSEEL